MELTRRGFLGQAAAGIVSVATCGIMAGSAFAAGTSAGSDSSSVSGSSTAKKTVVYAKTKAEVKKLEQVNTGVLVIGGGGAGVSAAISAIGNGAEVVLIEKEDSLGGATMLSSGKMPAVGTQQQIDKGVSDSIWALGNDILRPSNHSVREELVYTAAKTAADVIAWTGVMGVVWTVDDSLYYGQTNYRMHTADGAGAGLASTMIAYLEQQAAATVVTGTEVLGLIVDTDGSVIGAYTKKTAYLADNVVLATSGFGNNPQMIAEYCPEAADAVAIVAPGATGEGIRWAEELGASLQNMGAYQGYAFHTVDDDKSGEQTLANNGAIFVNAEGRRFTNEYGGYSELTPHILAQTDAYCWEICTDAQKATSGMWDVYDADGIVKTGASADELAAAIGVDAVELNSSIASYQAGIAAGMDVYNRSHLPADFNPPYYALKITGEIRHTQGGVATDIACHVLRSDGTLIPGLYAAGGCMEGFSSRGGAAYMSGNGILQALAFGKIAGANAALEKRGEATPAVWDGDKGLVATVIPTPEPAPEATDTTDQDYGTETYTDDTDYTYDDTDYSDDYADQNQETCVDPNTLVFRE